MAFFFREKFYQATQFLVIPYPLELLPKGEKKREKKKDPNMSHHVLQHRKIGKKKKKSLWIQNSRLSVSFAREQQVLQGCAHRH